MAVADPLLPEGDGHTPLGEDDIDGLIPTYITTRGELNAAEQDNVAHALTLAAPRTPDRVLDHLYLRRLHKQMFGDVWDWAGQYRPREMNIGIDPVEISMAVVDLCENAKLWIEASGEEDLAAARFHHRLVSVHPFRNGNGRHARRAADVLLNSAGLDAFTWGANADLSPDDLRARYLTSLRKADLDPEDLTELVEFARS